MPQTRLSVRYQPTFSGFEQATLSRGSAALAVPRATPKASRGDDAASFSYRNVSMSRVISGLHQTPADAPRRVGTRAPGKVCLGRSGAGLGYSVPKCQPGWRSQALGRGLAQGRASRRRGSTRRSDTLPGKALSCPAPAAPKAPTPWGRQDATPTDGALRGRDTTFSVRKCLWEASGPLPGWPDVCLSPRRTWRVRSVLS